jgi:hypothetical protein
MIYDGKETSDTDETTRTSFVRYRGFQLLGLKALNDMISV